MQVQRAKTPAKNIGNDAVAASKTVLFLAQKAPLARVGRNVRNQGWRICRNDRTKYVQNVLQKHSVQSMYRSAIANAVLDCGRLALEPGEGRRRRFTAGAHAQVLQRRAQAASTAVVQLREGGCHSLPLWGRASCPPQKNLRKRSRPAHMRG